jgi:uncharacterized protein YbbC (DUF1343 family)
MGGFFDGIEIEGVTADHIEAMMANDGRVPPGFYRAKLDGAKEITSNQKGTPGCELTFKIVGGQFNDCTVSDTLWKTDSDRLRDRIILFGLRLGVLARDPKSGKVIEVEGKTDFMDVLDTECIIEVIEDEYEKDGKKNKTARIAFGGCYAKDDKKAIEKIGKPVAAKPAISTTTPASAAKSKEASKSADKKFDTSNL